MLKKYHKENSLDFSDTVNAKAKNVRIIEKEVKKTKRIPKLEVGEIFNIELPENQELGWCQTGKEVW